MAEIGSISSSELGEYHVVEWRIAHFSTLGQHDNAYYWSPDFSFGDERWRLKIYPNGASWDDSSGHVDLGLLKLPSASSINVCFSLSLKTAKGERYREEHGTKNFHDGTLGRIFNPFTRAQVSRRSLIFFFTQIHVFSRFISRTELTRLRSDLLQDDVLTVVCIMKRWTPGGSDSDFASAEICAPVSDSAGCSSDSGECRHCRGNFTTGSLSSHQKKCEQRPVKCPECLEVVVLQKFLNEHECHLERPEDEACAPGSYTSPLQKKLHDDLKDLFLKRDDCDLIIKVKGSEIPAHKVILKTRSLVFASTFEHNMKEKATGIVEIDDCDPPPFMDLLRYIYYGDVGMISHENVFDLFSLADKYEVLDFRATCLEFVKLNITVETFCETITLALQHTETELIAVATDFFVKNSEEILENVKWQTFAAENPTQSNELVIKLVKWFKHSNVCISCHSQNTA